MIILFTIAEETPIFRALSCLELSIFGFFLTNLRVFLGSLGYENCL